MKSNFYESIDLEFLELSFKCELLPIEETKAEWKGKNRYSNNQPCITRFQFNCPLNTFSRR